MPLLWVCVATQKEAPETLHVMYPLAMAHRCKREARSTKRRKCWGRCCQMPPQHPTITRLGGECRRVIAFMIIRIFPQPALERLSNISPARTLPPGSTLPVCGCWLGLPRTTGRGAGRNLKKLSTRWLSGAFKWIITR